MPVINGPCVIDDTVVFGRNVIVWQFSSILPWAEIGDDCVIGSSVWIGRNVRLGKNVRIQDKAHITNNAIIGDDVFIGPGVMTSDDKYPRVGNKEYQSYPPIICDGASLGAGVILLPGVRIGKGAMVGAGAVVTRDVPPNLTVIGMPARERVQA